MRFALRALVKTPGFTLVAVLTLIPATSPLATQVRMDATVFAFAVAIGVGVTTLFGLVPALLGSRVNLNEALAAGGARSSCRANSP